MEFNYKRACGLWLIVVAVIISLATLIGGKQIINMQVFCIGYVMSFFSVNMNKKVLNKLSNGSSSKFQDKVSLYAIILLFVLMVFLGGLFCNWGLAINLVGCINGDRFAFFSILFCAWKINDIFGNYLYYKYCCSLYFYWYFIGVSCIYWCSNQVCIWSIFTIFSKPSKPRQLSVCLGNIFLR